jgi:CRISPR-associated protein Cmr4
MASISTSNSSPKGILVLGYAVTPLHPGVGRAPGAVDLPVQRDPLGYPIVFASSIKGALKAECARRVGLDKCIDGENGRLACDKCGLCCCLFGGELGGSEQAAGLLSVLDFIPLFVPVPSLSHGYVYVTTPYLAKRALTVLEVLSIHGLEGLKKSMDAIAGLDLGKGEARVTGDGEFYVSAIKLNTKGIGENLELDEVAKSIGGLARDLPRRLVVVSDFEGPLFIEKGLIRVSRIRLRVDTKTVRGGALWTEEYIPPGTIFLGGLVALTPKKNTYCGNNIVSTDAAEEKISEFIDKMARGGCTTYAVIGGKETIGRGLLKLLLYPCRNKGS